MKHVDLFNDFLKDTVNLNSTRVGDLETSTQAIEDFIDGSTWTPEIDSWMPQGSWAHKTIIKPVDQGEFDADLLVFIHPVKGWDAHDYIDQLYLAFVNNGTYKSKAKRWSHCVTITYANDKKIDVAPVIINREGYQRLEVCNRDTNSFEPTEPRKYTDWLIDQNSYSGRNSFRKVTRLLKYLRDIKGTFKCSSVLLTTLLGYRMSFLDKYGSDFTDTPTALKTVINRLDDYLQSNTQKPSVTNPYLVSEDFAAAWTDDQYTNFRTVINRYRGWIDDAYGEEERKTSISKWRRVFGDEFAADVALDEARSVSKVAMNKVLGGVSAAALLAHDTVQDLVALVRRVGERALPANFDRQPHMQQPRWKVAVTPSFAIYVKATLYQSKGYGRIREVQSLEPLPKDHWIEFRAVLANGLAPGAADFRVEWRITNTDIAAWLDQKSMRGGFEHAERDQSHSEQLKYRGVHLAEAFVIRKRDEVQVAQSAPFRVMVE